MLQVVEIKRSLAGLWRAVTVMFRDRSVARLALPLIPARMRVHGAVPFDALGCSVFDSIASAIAGLSSLSELLNVSRLRALCRRKVRHRASLPPLGAAALKFLKFTAEALQARSADLVCEINLNVGGQCAALSRTNQNTEQHRCFAV